MEQWLWIPATLIGSVGAFVIAGNWWMLIQSWRTSRFHSAIPIIGGVFGAAAMLVCPVAEVKKGV